LLIATLIALAASVFTDHLSRKQKPSDMCYGWGIQICLNEKIEPYSI